MRQTYGEDGPPTILPTHEPAVGKTLLRRQGEPHRQAAHHELDLAFAFHDGAGGEVVQLEAGRQVDQQVFLGPTEPVVGQLPGSSSKRATTRISLRSQSRSSTVSPTEIARSAMGLRLRPG